MKITLDHNCIIHLIDLTDEGVIIQGFLEDSNHQCFVVNIGASEMLQRGVFPNDYQRFDSLLKKAGVHSLPRLNPMAIIDVTFLDRSVYANDKMIEEVEKIQDILFPAANSQQKLASSAQIDKKTRNRLCDVHSLWCHIKNGNDIFLTTDRNFHKGTKKKALVEIGARQICRPGEIG